MKPFSLVAIIETQRPFFIGLGSLAIFFILYILVGSKGWGEPASWEQGIGEISRWCERVKEGLFHEPIHALSNIGFYGRWTVHALDFRKRSNPEKKRL